MDELQQLEEWVAPLLQAMGPGERMRLARTIGADLRRSQSQRIHQQKDPDGSPYTPRKKQLRTRAGRIKRQRMFLKLRQAKYLKVKASAEEVSVGFVGRVARIARVHQQGEVDAVRPSGPRVRYERRVVLGFTAVERERVKDLLIDHLRGV